jgi:carbon starvation protein
MPGAVIATLLVVSSWSYFIWTGSISTIWPMFGIANQLLATVALAVGTTVIINSGRGQYAWVTLAPMCFVATTTLTAGFLSVRDNFWPMAMGARPGLEVQGYMNTGLTVVMMTCVAIILVAAIRTWLAPRPRNADAV